MITRAQILAAARETLGTPFRHQGRLVGVGLDCAGVACYVAERLGLRYDAPLDYPREPYRGQLRGTLDAQPCLTPTRDPQPGDVLLMRFAREPQHVGIMTDIGVLHSYEAIGRVVEHRLDDVWSARIVAAYRFAGVVDEQ